MCDSDSGLSLSVNECQVDSSCHDNVFIRVKCSEIDYEDIHSFNCSELICDVKSKILQKIQQPIKDQWNYGLFLPPSKGKSGKFLQNDRTLRDYPFDNSIGLLELKYKQRVFRMITANMSKLKKIQNKTTQRQFMSSVKLGEVERVNKWLNKGLDPNFQSKDTGDTPLCVAVQADQPRGMILALAAGGAHLDYRATDTMSPLHRAATLRNYEAIKVLLDLGQSPNILDRFGLTPLYYAVLNDTVALCVERLLFDHAELGTSDEAGLQEIHQACRFGRVQHLDVLISYGADINSQTSKNGNTPLHICAIMDREACARLLLFRGSDRTIRNSAGHTAQQQATLSDCPHIADLISAFQDKDIVPIRCVPKRNPNRRSVKQSLQSHQRCSSTGHLSTLVHHKEDKTSREDCNGEGVNLPFARRSSMCSDRRLAGSISGYCLDSLILDEAVDPRTLSIANSRTSTNANTEEYNGSTVPRQSRSTCNLNSFCKSNPSNQVTPYPNHSATVQLKPKSTRRPELDFDVKRTSDGPRSISRSCLGAAWLTRPQQDNGSDIASIFSSTSSVRGTNPHHTLGSTNRLQTLLDHGESILSLDTSCLPRMIVLQRGPQGFGFVIRGRKSLPCKSQASLSVPATQHLEKVEPGSAASRAGLTPGDFILEVNGTDVTKMSHEAVVDMIRSSGDILGLKVITVNSRYSQLMRTPTCEVNSDPSTCHRDAVTNAMHHNSGPDAPNFNHDSVQPMRVQSIKSESTPMRDCHTLYGKANTLQDQLTPSQKSAMHFVNQKNTTDETPVNNQAIHTHIPKPPTLVKSPVYQTQPPSTSSLSSPPLTCSTSKVPESPNSRPWENMWAGLLKKNNFGESNDSEGFPLPPPPAEQPEVGIPSISNGGAVSSSVNRQYLSERTPSFDDHLREAVARRRRKIEMVNSDDETIDDARVISTCHRDNRSTLYTSNKANPNVIDAVKCDPNKELCTNGDTLRRNQSMSHKIEGSSFKVIAEQFRARALAKGHALHGTIPPPESFQDTIHKENSPLSKATKSKPSTLSSSGDCSKMTLLNSPKTPPVTFTDTRASFASVGSSTGTNGITSTSGLSNLFSSSSPVVPPPPPPLLNRPACQPVRSGLHRIK